MTSTQTSTATAPAADAASSNGGASTSEPPRPHVEAQGGTGRVLSETPTPVIECEGVDIYYGDFRAVNDVSLIYGRNEITAMIGPSGCGKSTVLRSLNRMNDLIPGARVTGRISYHGQDMYGTDVDPIEVRRRIGMVSRSRTRFRSRSTTTSPTARG
jgi:phosphate transport system ATP-binding protein